MAPLQLKAASGSCHHWNALGERSGGWGAANGYLESSLSALSMSFWTRMSQSSDRSGATLEKVEKRIIGAGFMRAKAGHDGARIGSNSKRAT